MEHGFLIIVLLNVFEINGLLEGEKAIGHTAYEKVKNKVDERVVISNKCIISKGLNTSFDFDFTLARILFPKDEIEKLQDFMIY